MNDGPEENNTDDEPEEENIMDSESGEMYPTLSVDGDLSEIPLDVIFDGGGPIMGRPVIRVLTDSFSRTILGTHVHIEGLDADQAQGEE